MRKNALKSLQIQNLLSFGEESPAIELGNLNVLIGPNGSGKSNLIEVIGLLRGAGARLPWPAPAGRVSDLKYENMRMSVDESAPAPLDPVLLARLWPNRHHESNWLKDAFCSVGFHRWYPVEIGDGAPSKITCTFCRWCPKVKGGEL